MKYARVHVDAIAYELPAEVVTSEDLERRLQPLYEALHLQSGLLEEWTGIRERRWWERGRPLWQGAALAARRCLEQAAVAGSQIETLIYAGVCRDQFEPATACAVADALRVHPHAHVYDLSNACLGVLNGMLDVANRIELKQIRAGMVVSCETARDITETILGELLRERSMDVLTRSLATLTGGSGAVAVLLSDGSLGPTRHRLLGGVAHTAPEHHRLCRWGLAEDPSAAESRTLVQSMATDSAAVLKHGLALGVSTWQAFLAEMAWSEEDVDKVICHQVGAAHRERMLDLLHLPSAKDFSTFPTLGNMGTVSLPLSAALAEERGFLQSGDLVGFLGIGSGLNSVMLGLQW